MPREPQTPENTYYTAVTCPVAGCVLTATHRHPEHPLAAEWHPRPSGAMQRGDRDCLPELVDPAGPADGEITFTGAEVLAAIAQATEQPAYVEMTGGGVATVYIGTPELDEKGDGRYLLCVGPGTFDWREDGARSTFYASDLSVGPDDDGEGAGAIVTTLAELTQAVRDLLAVHS